MGIFLFIIAGFSQRFIAPGSIWISKVKTLKKFRTFYSPSYGYFLINFDEAIDIDTYDDLILAKKFI